MENFSNSLKTIDKYISNFTDKAKDQNFSDLSQSDFKFVDAVIDLKIQLLSITSNMSDSSISNQTMSSIVFLEQFLDSNTFVDFARIVVNFRIKYEMNYHGKYKSNRKNSIVQLLTKSLLENINDFIKMVTNVNSLSTSVKLNSTEARLNLYDQVLSGVIDYTTPPKELLLALLSSIDSISFLVTKCKRISTTKGNDLELKLNRGIPLLVINNYISEDKVFNLDYEREIQAFSSFFNNTDFYVLFNPTKEKISIFLHTLCPSILHYCGHSDDGGIPLKNLKARLKGAEIAHLYNLSSSALEFCILNSCDSNYNAFQINDILGTRTIGFIGDLPNAIAMVFSEELYSVLDGKSGNITTNISDVFIESITSTKANVTSCSELTANYVLY